MITRSVINLALNRRERAALLALSCLLVLLPHSAVSAQESGPVYIVQSGDSLSSIAARFNLSVDELMQANGITDPDLLAVGQELVIPGLAGITGTLDTEFIGLGDSYRTLVRRTQLPEELLRQLNRLVSPTEFYVGASMIVPSVGTQSRPGARFSAVAGESLFELSVRADTDAWTMAALNGLAGTWAALPGDVLYAYSGNDQEPVSGLPGVFKEAQIRNLPIKQGETVVIEVRTEAGTTVDGRLVDRELHFLPGEDGAHVSLQGVHALLTPGVYPLRLDATLTDGSQQSFEQMVLIVSGNYAPEVIPVNDAATIDPAVSEAELRQVSAITAPVTPRRAWQGLFQIPVAPPGLGCIKDWFGRPRTYLAPGTDATLTGFHAGVDFGVCSNSNPFDIYAPAPGIIVFAGPLPVCGNATIIDHGWGVFSRFCHQSEINVAVGQSVQAGELTGKIGATGRVTGPHLHWEVWVGGVQVEPLDWLEQTFP
jgi:murein DD-endopeptidase MepM/ murein hydrolase activator NlpD